MMEYKSQLIVGLALMLGSCASYHTPISRSIQSMDTQPLHVANNGGTGFISPDSNFKNELSRIPIQFDWPVDDARLTRGFLPQLRKPHLGLDLASSRGSGIFASHSGTVIYTGRDFRGYGRMIMIESPNGWATLYAHLDKFYVQEGQKVTQGEMIAAMGNSGRSTGVHLHFEIRKLSGPIDPLPLLPGGEKIQKLISMN